MQALCGKLKTHWTSIAFHLYLKADVPVPIPSVGPLAELLHVTRGVCQEMLALAAAGKLSAPDIAVALDTNTVHLLGRLVQWLQAEPNEPLLLNTERSESLWQLLLLTLANLLKVLQQAESVDAAMIQRFRQQLQGSGVLGPQPGDSSSDDSSSTQAPPADAAAAAPTGGLLGALQWLLQHHPQRCLTASHGAWLLLQELSTNVPAQQQQAAAEPQAAAAGEEGSSSQQPAAAATAAQGAIVPPALGALLQGYVDCAYRNAAQPPTAAPLSQGSVGASGSSSATAASGRNSGSGNVRKMASREKIDSSSGCSSPTPAAAASAGGGGGAGTPRKRGTASPPSGSSSSAADAAGSSSPPPAAAAADARPELSDSRAVLQGYSHAVCLVDDPSTALFKHLLVQLHALQVQLLVLAASAPSRSVQQKEDEEQEEEEEEEEDGLPRSARDPYKLPHALHVQVLACVNSWLQQHSAAPSSAPAAVAAAGGGEAGEQQYEHQVLLPLPAVAAAAVTEVTMDHLDAVQHLMKMCTKALEFDCFKSIMHIQQQQQQQAKAAAAAAGGDEASSSKDAAAATSSSTTSSSSSVDVDKVDFAAVAKLVLESVSLQLAAGGTPRGLNQCFNAFAVAARCCPHSQLMQLLQQQGKELLHVLSLYIRTDDSSSSSSDAAAGDAAPAELTAEERERDTALRCVVCARVFMDVCSRGRLGVDDYLLGSLTETDPATFYSIMDMLVRKVHPESLTVLLPLSACFLQHDMTTVSELLYKQRLQQQQDSSPDSSSSISGSGLQELIAASRSLVILHDPDVCRTFAAALHGYCKTVLAHLPDEAGGGGCSGGSCGHDHAHDHEHEHDGHDHEHDHHHHHVHVGAMLSPLGQVTRWLLFSYDVTMKSVQDDSHMQQLKAEDAAAAAAAAAAAEAGGGGGAAASSSSSADSDSGSRLLASVDRRAKQLQEASHAAAGSLVLTILLSRAGIPILNWMEAELTQLAPAAAAGSSGSNGDVELPLLTAANMMAALAFVRDVWQTICARYALSQMLDEQLHQLVKAAAAASQTSAALKQQVQAASGGKRAAAAAAAADSGSSKDTEAAAAAERVAAGLKLSASATNAAFQGRGMARGWSHLGFLLPPNCLQYAKAFQTSWPGDLFNSCKAASILDEAQRSLRQQQHAHHAGGGDDDDGAAAVATTTVLSEGLKRELLQLVSDARHMLTGLMNDVPLPVGCNNPGCMRIEAVAEATLSINKRCSSCLAAHYCCKQCQTDHWPAHKAACKRLRLASSSSQGGGGSGRQVVAV